MPWRQNSGTGAEKIKRAINGRAGEDGNHVKAGRSTENAMGIVKARDNSDSSWVLADKMKISCMKRILNIEPMGLYVGVCICAGETARRPGESLLALRFAELRPILGWRAARLVAGRPSPFGAQN